MFGSAPIEPHRLLRELVSEVRKHVDGKNWSRGENTAYTLAVKETLKNIAATCSATTKCFYTAAEPGMKEFLLDLVWWDDDGIDGALLACECEWQYARFSNGEAYPQAVGEDFGKLLVFKAPLKLMIFATPQDSPEIGACVIREIERYLRKYRHHVEGEVYLILDFAPAPKAWIAIVEQHGASQPVLRSLLI